MNEPRRKKHNRNRPEATLNGIKSTLLSDFGYTDAHVLRSKRNVPYLWCSKHKLNISVCYFLGTNNYKIWTGTGTVDNKCVGKVGTQSEAVNFIARLVV